MEMDRVSKSSLKCMAILVLLLKWATVGSDCSEDRRRGRWQLLLNNTGVVAMHMALTHSNTVILFDQTSGQSRYRLGGKRGKRRPRCRPNSADTSCWAHSMEYRIDTNTIRPLTLKTDTWCSSGSFLSNGTLMQTGGAGKGAKRIRYFSSCSSSRCDWTESDTAFLSENRWYATNQILPSNRMIVVGGRNTFTYEFVPKSHSKDGAFELPFLRQTNNRAEGGNNLYPFVYLSSDGNLFIFANRDSILFDYKKKTVVKKFPRMPGNGARNYPSTGSSVMLPLDHENNFQKVEIMVCGGAASGAYKAAKEGNFLKGQSSCGRLAITAEKPKWAMEEMPGPRLLNDMLILPTGNILIINGAKRGSAGWNRATAPSLKPYLYKPRKKLGNRFSVLKSTDIPRMYHSTALLLPDGRILVGGSNPHDRYTFTGVKFPTEMRLQAYVPYYMGNFFDDRRAANLSIGYRNGEMGVGYGGEFSVRFVSERRPSKVEFHAYAPPFVSHSVSMGQRMLKLLCKKMVRREGGEMNAVLMAPPSPTVAPSGYYLLTVVNGGFPSKAEWVRFLLR